MGRIKRGNFIFVYWTGDHPPYHIHVYREGKLVVKWDLENDRPMKGQITRQILKYIEELKEEGVL
ncbi:MAG TPA: DUF4160 domain-containing protein [Candidatus Latescibacteria bacterium]|nr:DUF4160 domain-containing protein [Candidatus Handelsmanbacteria bacterium]HIL09949.1 DUF4160 domain-containing protein [Candidatus Latescibacterota bacterium]